MTRHLSQSCFEQIKGFGSYGFPESHAASFALLVYVSAWIKKHHPAAFAAALLNSQPMGFYAPAEIVRCARDDNVTVLAPDAAFSDWDNTLERDAKGALCLRLGFRQIDGFARSRCADHHARSAAMAIADFADFARRTALSQPRAGDCWPRPMPFAASGWTGAKGCGRCAGCPMTMPLPLFAPRAAPEQGAEAHRAPARHAAQRACAGRLPDHAPVAERLSHPVPARRASTPKASRPAAA